MAPTSKALEPPELNPKRWSILAACILITSGNLIRPPLHHMLPPFPEEVFGAAFLADLGGRVFSRGLEAMGLPPELIDQARTALDRALQPAALADPTIGERTITAALLGLYHESYALAVGGVTVVIAVLMTICVTLVWFGLRPGLVQALDSSPSTST